MDAFAQGFWRDYERFLKVPLVTELPNSRTAELSRLAAQEMEQALRLLFSLDREVISQFIAKNTELLSLQRAVALALVQGGRVFLVGCGASARMAAQIEYLWRLYNPGSEQVRAVIAGGDIALIEAVERCEDEPAFAIKHLQMFNFCEHDLLIGLSASGESPFIVQAVEYALQVSALEPWFLFANPRERLLARNPQHVLASDRCQGLELCVGAMALTGSTRMQATTMMTLVLLATFFDIEDKVPLLLHRLANLPWGQLAELAQFEIKTYQQKNYMVYEAAASYALSVLADVTERSPTFNVPILECAGRAPALAYVVVEGVETSLQAWRDMLGRSVQNVNWNELAQTQDAYLAQFNLSSAYIHEREVRIQPHTLQHVKIHERGDVLEIKYSEDKILIDVKGLPLALRQLLLRLILVNHSTVVFGALGFYQGNLMTYVKPSNFKLVDRAVRYILFLAQTRYQRELDYRKVAELVLAMRETLLAHTSVVEMVLMQALG